MIVTRENLLSLLNSWQQNKITTIEFYDSVSNIYDNCDYIDWEDDKEENSVMREVVGYLEMLDLDFITQEDIEPCKEFLRTPNWSF